MKFSPRPAAQRRRAPGKLKAAAAA